ncbi:MAG: LPXTG cell wall anchor domain-containing protein [Eubacteriaceae bacterium]|nr:LPXTG cell wall anchor domain-containing protein [Eubacteriaceae bacterium]
MGRYGSTTTVSVGFSLTDNPQTGEDSRLYLCGGLMLSALGVAIGLKKKKRSLSR